jgi:hypothetical protein
MISAVTPGTVARAVALFAARSPITAGRELAGSPRGNTASAILVPRLAENFAVKMALSGS